MINLSVFILVTTIGSILGQDGEAIVEEYQLPFGMDANDNGYGADAQSNCHMEERIHYEDVCEPYEEEMCYTQAKEKCQPKPYKNCTGMIDNQMARVCLNVTEMLCSLQQKIDYKAVQENYKVQKCTTVRDRVCDTTYHIAVTTKDDYQCIDLESQYCEDKEAVVNDVVCKFTFNFNCNKPKRGEGGYGQQRVCTREPLQNCYETPRIVRHQICRPQIIKHCEKFTNPTPRPVERQNCHFEPKKKCELQDMMRPRKVKRYSYHKDCKKIPREICDMAQKKSVVPHCVVEHRNECRYLPEEYCDKSEKQYCYKQERVEMEEVCNDKLAQEFL